MIPQPQYRAGTAAASIPMWARWVFFVALLLGEVILASLLFDTAALDRQRHAWWVGLMGHAPQFLRLGMVVVAALVLFASRAPTATVTIDAGPARRWGAPKLPLVAHFAVYLLLLAVTLRLLSGQTGAAWTGTAWFIVWVATGVNLLAFWGLAALPERHWPLIGQRVGRFLPLGLAVGGGAFAAAALSGLMWRYLTPITFTAVHFLLRLFFPQVISDAAIAEIGTPSFMVHIAPECSGCEGIGLILVFVSAYLWSFRHDLRFPHALLLLPAGAAVMFLANVVRIVALIAIGSWGWADIALGGFHSQAGWLAFIGISLGLIVLSRRVRVLGAVAAAPTAEPATVAYPSAPWLLPLLLLVGTAMVTGIFTTGFDTLYPFRLGLVGAVLLLYRRHYRLQWSFSLPAVIVGVAVFFLWMALERPNAAAGATIERGLAALHPAARFGWLAARVLGSVSVVPLAEELAFRGYLLRRLSGAPINPEAPVSFSWTAFIASSVFFGLLHQRWLAGVIAGVLYTGLFFHRRRVADAVMAHALTNGLIALYVLTSSAWSVWA